MTPDEPAEDPARDLSDVFPPDAPGATRKTKAGKVQVPDERPDPEGTPFEDIAERRFPDDLTDAEQVLAEMLQIERAAAAFYADLLERVKATPELHDYIEEIADMAEEEAEHATMVQTLLADRGIEVVVED